MLTYYYQGHKVMLKKLGMTMRNSTFDHEMTSAGNHKIASAKHDKF